ncbi:uncharacterized protein METZ01_LOCUS495331 [marine metagenome]|uniref:Uncharacterized protein n=1 Tax=marine metagenome TaxID=408172 RepID=A0A383DDA8_9ZZZZ
MKLQQIADDLCREWNDERFNPWWFRYLLYFALGLWTFAMVYISTSP